MWCIVTPGPGLHGGDVVSGLVVARSRRNGAGTEMARGDETRFDSRQILALAARDQRSLPLQAATPPTWLCLGKSTYGAEYSTAQQ